MNKLWIVIIALVTQDCTSQDEDDGPYRGKFIGRLNSYHHQVSGEVYAVDEWTVLLVNFNYDGTGDDTFFWAGDAGRPGPQGFIVPDEHGKTNILEQYKGQEAIRLRLPEGKRLSRIKWLAVYDIDSQNTFGDVYVPDEFEAPAPRDLAALAGAASSKPVRVLSATTLLIPELRYDGNGEEVYFWAGVGPQPSPKGFKIPDEYGYLEPIRAYNGEDVTLSLPGGRTVFDVNWIALYDLAERRSLATLLMPEGLNVPPAASLLHSYKASLPHCKQLHRDYQVSWEVFGPQVTFELAATLRDSEYMSWGLSGDDAAAVMVGADLAVLSYYEPERRGLAADYNVSAQGPCVSVLGRWQGVCRDSVLGGQDSNQVFMSRREDGLTVISYRRTLSPAEELDKPWPTSSLASTIWALGSLDKDGEPAYHRAYPRAHLALNLTQHPPVDDCFPFTMGAREFPTPWERPQLFDPSVRVFEFSVGPSGGLRGLAGRGGGSPALAWYVNGQLAPDLQLRRGLSYTFKARGGSDPHSPTLYHPLVITSEPRGGIETLPLEKQSNIRVLAGAGVTRRGRLSPLAAGALCVGKRPNNADPRRDDDFKTFRAFNRSLSWSCAAGAAGELSLTPNSTWPDLVYYHSFTHPDMGGRIFVVDRHKRTLGRASSDASLPHAHWWAFLLLPIAIAILCRR